MGGPGSDLEAAVEATTLHRRTVELWQSRLAAVGAGQWGAATPCSEWDVHALVNHVVGEELWAVPLLGGATIAEVGDRFQGDVLGPDPHGTARRAAVDATEAAAQVPAAATVHLSYGEEKAEEYLRQLAADHLVHAWDLAVAVGGDRYLDPELVREVAGWFTEREDTYRGFGIIGPHAGASGDPQTDLLAAFGRDVRWATPE